MLGEGRHAVDDDSATLYEAIYNDRRLTTRNIVRWIDQVLNTLLLFHKGYTCVGDFGIRDIRLGPDSSLGSTKAFSEHLLNTLKSGQDAMRSLNFSPSVKKKKESDNKDRSVVLDFQRKLSAASNGAAQTTGSATIKRTSSPERSRRRLPRGFDCQYMTQFDARHDNNIVVQKDHRLHNSIAEHYHEYVHNVCMDLRCLAIVILQIYTLSVFSEEERSKIMYFQPPPQAPTLEEEEEEDEQPSLTRTATATGPGAAKGGKDGADASRRASSAGMLPTANGKDRAGSPVKTGGAVVKPGSARDIKSTGTASTAKGASAGAGAAENGATETKKLKRRAKQRNTLELALLPAYPCIERMPAEVKELLIDVCFKRPADVLEESVAKIRGEMCTKFEFSLLVYVKDCKEALHNLVVRNQESAHHETPEIWTPADERARLAAQRERQERYAQLAQEGPRKAEARLRHEKYLLWYSMQSDDYKGKLEQRQKARRRAEKHIVMRRKYIYLASFHRWSMINFTSWVQEALLDYCNMLQELRLAAILEKKKNKNPAVYVTRLINDLLAVFTKTAITKLTAFQNRRAEEDSVGYEKAITLVKPQTSAGKRPNTSTKMAGTSLKSIMHSLDSMRLVSGDNSVAGSATNSTAQNSHTQSFAQNQNQGDEHSVTSLESSTSQGSYKQPVTTLPSIKKPKMTAAQSRNAKKKEETFVPKVLTPDEILVNCFKIVAGYMAKILTAKQKNPFDLCSNMAEAMRKQEKDASEAAADRILITSEEQLYFKRIAAQAAYFTSSTKFLRTAVVEFCDLIELMDRGWVKFMVYMISSSVMHHYNRDAVNRAKGENYATDRIIAFFRGIVVRNIVRKVWQRTYQLHPFILSPLSSRTPSMRASPAMSMSRKRLSSLASYSSDTHNSDGGRSQKGKHVHMAPEYPPPPQAATQKGPKPPQQFRKPFYIKEVHTPSAVSMKIDFSVSLKSGETPPEEHNKYKHFHRLTQRHGVWKNISCRAYIETEVPETSVSSDAPAKQLIAESGLFAANALRPATSSSSTHNHAHVQSRIEQPVNRKLVIRLMSNKEKMFEDNVAPGMQATHIGDNSTRVRRIPVKAELVTLHASHHETDLESVVSDALSGSAYKSVTSTYKHSSMMGKENKANAALALWTDPVPSDTEHHNTEAEEIPPVVAYRVELDDLRSYSCYEVHIVLDKFLAEDLKEGNKSYFRSLAHQTTNDDDNHSVGSNVSEEGLDYAEVGKAWSMNESLSVAHNDTHTLSTADAVQLRADALHVNLTQYIATKPGIPRTVKALTAKIAYHSTDAPGLEAATAAVASMLRFHPHPHSTGLSAATGRRTILQPSAHNLHPEYAPALQGCIELHWAQSEDDSHSHTHYEVQRRLLLVNTVEPTKLTLPPPRLPLSPGSKARARRKRDAPPPVVEQEKPPFEETIYIGPWKHAVGLNSALSKARGGSSSSTRAVSQSKSRNTMMSTPHHASSCTDRVALPTELDANPDAYNSVIGYLCATLPDMVIRATEKRDQSAADHHQEQISSAEPLQFTTQEDLLNQFVESGLSIGYEYRVRAVNSAGPGKFNASKSYIPLSPTKTPSTTTSAVTRKVCVVQLARVCTHLAQLCDFRAHHPKYRSHNAQLVNEVLTEHVERAQTAQDAARHSGDPFVEYLVALKDTPAEGVVEGVAEREGGAVVVVGEEGIDKAHVGGKALASGVKNGVNSIEDWLMALQEESPLL